MATVDDASVSSWSFVHSFQAALSSVDSSLAKLDYGLELVIKEPKYLDIK